MTGEERKEQIEYHLAELKKLRATPRSDWHAGFEALLKIETFRYEDKVSIRIEEEIGIMPPRTDFIILVEDEKVEFEKEIFKSFRRYNIIEYKNPADSLNERVIRKVCGYANLLIGSAEHEGDIPSDQVTLSIFRAAKNSEMFAQMEKEGNLKKSETPGIYNVNGITDIPFQIVITDELKGEEYAAYRALTEKAAEEDVTRVIEEIEEEENEVLREYYRVLFGIVIEKNPDCIWMIRRRTDMDRTAADIFVEVYKDKVDEIADERADERARETKIIDIKNLMTNLKLTVEQAMEALSIPQSQWETYAGLVSKAKQ